MEALFMGAQLLFRAPMEFKGAHGPGWHLWRGIINCRFRSVLYVTHLLISAYSRLIIFGADGLAPSAPASASSICSASLRSSKLTFAVSALESIAKAKAAGVYKGRIVTP
jgi:hypothetical protein